MKKVTLRKISFGTYVKMYTLGAAGFGLLAGLSGAPISASIGSLEYSGLMGDMMYLFTFPVVYSAFFAGFSVVFYPFFCLALRIFKGIKIAIQTDDIAADENLYS